MYKLFLGLVAIALFIGCSSKEEKALLKSYEENIKYHKYLQQTEKTELYENNVSVAILTATHLYTPNFDKNDTRDEVFIVGVQFEKDNNSIINFDKNATSSKKTEYILTLNKMQAISVVSLSSNDKRLDKLSFVADWGNYYEIKFKNTGNRFSLVFENAIYGKANLNFSKIAKYVYTKKGF